ncbi:transketolase, N-terminal subunit [Kurthia zopfii]|uniref:Transketolase 1 n=1 Tax=Kurthia zopfii TaxID=1650 RepID=A0A8B4Q646_9BACL|nr:transketolase [Kurthia zopfii]TDR39254.1 transketolase subunit A [Kurthia zopfii]GEK31430.1 transketolase, N-terminal subunit [Kurthia zopfii]STX08799.1 Transketolase 1 [Kurthia zopfii]
MVYNLTEMSKAIRKRSIDLAFSSGNNAAHLGPGLSLVEIFTALYGYVMKISNDMTNFEDRDRLILSKEHGVLSYYAALEYIELIGENDLDTFMKSHSEFLGHPVMNRAKGIEFTSGSLGMGLSLGIGVSIALKKKKSNSKVYVILGDGECNEGSIWESVMSASMQKLDNLVVIVDRNGYQLGGKIEETLDMGDLREKFKVFGWNSVQCDGHDVNDIISKIKSNQNSDKPFALIANTIKGKGVSFAENNIEWHHSVLTKNLYKQALQDIGVVYE